MGGETPENEFSVLHSLCSSH